MALKLFFFSLLHSFSYTATAREPTTLNLQLSLIDEAKMKIIKGIPNSNPKLRS